MEGKKNKNANRKGRGMSSNPPNANQILYRGPVKLQEAIEPEIKTVELHALTNVSTTVTSGTVDLNVSSGTVRTNATSFSSWATLYREYRVLGIRANFIPDFENDHVGTPTVSGTLPWATVVDRDDASAVGSVANIVDNTSLIIYPLNRRWIREAKMDSTVEADFVAVTTDPSGFFAIKLFTTGQFAAVTGLGVLYATYLVQFKTRI
jgi:hypothetical protein